MRAGHRIRHTISRAEFSRRRLIARFTPHAAGDAVAAITDAIHETRTIASHFFTDAMVAVWLSQDDLQARFPQLDEETCQYAYLAWYTCRRPVEGRLHLSSEPTNQILRAMSDLKLTDESQFGFACTALMLAAFCYASGYNDVQGLGVPACQADDIVPWFFCEGAYHLHVSHCIQQATRIELAAARSGGPSAIVTWTMDRIALAPGAPVAVDRAGLLAHHLATRGDDAARWRDLLREALLLDGEASFDDPPSSVVPPVCARLGAAVQERAELLLVDGQPEYLCEGGQGYRLLVQGEWYPAESAFVWSRAPISTLLFCVAGGPVDWLRIGLLFDRSPMHERRFRILLNHNPIWMGTITEASSGELMLAATGRSVSHEAPNLLQFEVDEPFVPAAQSLSSDNRTLGVGLKRIWVQRGTGVA